MRFSELREGQIWEDSDGDYIELYELTNDRAKFRIARPVTENARAEVWRNHGERAAEQWESVWEKREWDRYVVDEWRLIRDVGPPSEEARRILEELGNMGPAG